jgi:hypothetical protein
MGAKQGKYQGEMKNGKREGWGICAFADRSYYEGEWVADQMDGKVVTIHFLDAFPHNTFASVESAQ